MPGNAEVDSKRPTKAGQPMISRQAARSRQQRLTIALTLPITPS
jgi:hypothetical protein